LNAHRLAHLHNVSVRADRSDEEGRRALDIHLCRLFGVMLDQIGKAGARHASVQLGGVDPQRSCTIIDRFLAQGSISAARTWSDLSRLFGEEGVVHLPELSLLPRAMLGPSGRHGMLVESQGHIAIIETGFASLDVFVENLRINTLLEVPAEWAFDIAVFDDRNLRGRVPTEGFTVDTHSVRRVDNRLVIFALCSQELLQFIKPVHDELLLGLQLLDIVFHGNRIFTLLRSGLLRGYVGSPQTSGHCSGQHRTKNGWNENPEIRNGNAHKCLPIKPV